MRKTRGRKRRGDAALRPSVWPGRMQVQLRIPRMLRLLRAALSCGDRGDAGRSCRPPLWLAFSSDLFSLLQRLGQLLL